MEVEKSEEFRQRGRHLPPLSAGENGLVLKYSEISREPTNSNLATRTDFSTFGGEAAKLRSLFDEKFLQNIAMLNFDDF